MSERLDEQVREPTRPHYSRAEHGFTSQEGGARREIGTAVVADVGPLMPQPPMSELGCTSREGDHHKVGAEMTGNFELTGLRTGEGYSDLEPLRTIQNPFVDAVSYRTY